MKIDRFVEEKKISSHRAAKSFFAYSFIWFNSFEWEINVEEDLKRIKNWKEEMKTEETKKIEIFRGQKKVK